MKDHPLYPLTSKLRPELKDLNGGVFLQAFSEVLTILYLSPFAILGIVWLVLTNNNLPPLQDILLLGLLTIGILITNSQSAMIYVRIGTKEKLALSSSLGSVLYWAGLLLWGPIAIWASLIADTLTNTAGVFHARKLNQNIFWGPFSNLFQSISPLPGILAALWLYNFMGGVFPFNSVDIKDWLPALTAIVVSAVFPSLLMLPIFTFITSLTGTKSSFSAAVQFIFSALAFSIIPAPFGIPLALLFVKAGTWSFMAMVVGVVLVNYMAHHLSRTNQRNIQQAQEMEQLEKLGEEILKSSPDGTGLAEILHKRIKSMFSGQLDIIALHLFDDVPLPGFTGDINALGMSHPTLLELGPSIWESLRQSKETHIILKDQIPQGFKSVYGDAVLVKISSAAPVSDESEPVCLGGIYLLMNMTTSRTLDSLSALQALASQIASALYRVQVYNEALTTQKMSQELAFAGQIQSSFLPERVPALEGWSIAADLIPARQTSGDFYDFIELPNGKLGVVVADVADKGTGAALYMALSRTLLRTFAQQYPDQPAEALRMTNNRLFEDSRADQFVTVFYGVLQPASGRFEYCNAGHNPAIFLHNGNDKIEMAKRTGVALGAMEGLTWTSSVVIFNKGDTMLLYTDGVVEAQDKYENFYGEERLINCAKMKIGSSSEAIQSQVIEELKSFVGDADQFDDITLTVLKRI